MLIRLGIVLTAAWLLLVATIIASTPVRPDVDWRPIVLPIVLLWSTGAAMVWVLRGGRP